MLSYTTHYHLIYIAVYKQQVVLVSLLEQYPKAIQSHSFQYLGTFYGKLNNKSYSDISRRKASGILIVSSSESRDSFADSTRKSSIYASNDFPRDAQDNFSGISSGKSFNAPISAVFMREHKFNFRPKIISNKTFER